MGTICGRVGVVRTGAIAGGPIGCLGIGAAVFEVRLGRMFLGLLFRGFFPLGVFPKRFSRGREQKTKISDKSHGYGLPSNRTTRQHTTARMYEELYIEICACHKTRMFLGGREGTGTDLVLLCLTRKTINL